jgi:hypothetical protein
MKKIIVILAFVFISLSSFSQSYFTAFGARFGTDWGITVQQKVLKHTTIEGIFQSSLFREETMVSVLAEQHFPLVTKRVNFYLGAGWHQGFVTSTPQLYPSPQGITAIAGAEITLARFAVSYDFKPAFNLYGGENSWYTQSGLSVRYVIIQQNAIEKMKKKRQREKRRDERIERRQEFFNKDSK